MSTVSVPLTAQDILTESQYQKFPLGQLGETNDGRSFRYCKAGGTALAPGKLQQNPAEDTNFHTLAVNATAAIGAKTIKVTLGGTAVTASLFKEGFAIIAYGTGAGYTYKVRAHSVQTSTTGSLTVELEDGLVEALDTTSKVCLKRNPYDAVIVLPTTPTGAVVGAAVYPITAAYYGWLQVGGIGLVLADTTGWAVGDMIGPTTQAGDDGEAITAVLAQGYAGDGLSTGTSGYYRPVLLKI